MQKTLALYLAAACIGMLGSVSRVWADPPPNTNSGRYAIGGYDPVAYFEEHKPVQGRAEYQTKYRGATWLFASEAHKRAFEGAPTRYEPSYNGYCAYAAALGKLASIDPNAWAIVDGHLYLNYSLEVRTKWNADRERYIRDANAHWPIDGSSHR
jgi:YHS domain-containing protein